MKEFLDDDIARQGVRIRVNLKPVKYFRIGGSYSKRFQSDQQNKSDNLYGYATYSKLPGIGGSVTINYNNNKSNYLTSNIASVNYSRYFLKNKLNTVFLFIDILTLIILAVALMHINKIITEQVYP